MLIKTKAIILLLSLDSINLDHVVEGINIPQKLFIGRKTQEGKRRQMLVIYPFCNSYRR